MKTIKYLVAFTFAITGLGQSIGVYSALSKLMQSTEVTYSKSALIGMAIGHIVVAIWLVFIANIVYRNAKNN